MTEQEVRELLLSKYPDNTDDVIDFMSSIDYPTNWSDIEVMAYFEKFLSETKED